jgi:quaternary ammonium compound-resistance protein SugE
MNWFILFVAGLFEVVWAVGLKYTDGFTRLWPSVGTAVAMAISAVLLAIALKTLPVGTGYAIWVGIGAIGTAIAGIVLFGETVSTLKIASIALLVAGMAGLKLGSGA